jgi:hypothetical protein
MAPIRSRPWPSASARTIALLALAVTGCATPNPSATSVVSTAPAGPSSSTTAPSSAGPASAAPSNAISSPSGSAGPSAGAAGLVPDRDPARLEPGGTYRPAIDPTGFVAVIDNPYWPLAPGTQWSFRSKEERTETTVTPDHHPVMGVPTVVVHDQVFNGSDLVEDTFDWYAQDKAGNVWYFGEATTSYEDNPAGDHAGSWEGGVDGAQPGIVMLADPLPGDVYRQEFKAGEAEDIAMVRRLDAKLKVPAGSYGDVLVTEEWTPLEPDIIELKYYAKGIGVIEERQILGGDELVQLRTMRPPGG